MTLFFLNIYDLDIVLDFIIFAVLTGHWFAGTPAMQHKHKIRHGKTVCYSFQEG